LSDGGADCRGAEEPAAAMVDLFGFVDLGHGNSPCLITLYGSRLLTIGRGRYVRNGRKPARTSSEKSCGCSQAA
jgi:hypothetical protein